MAVELEGNRQLGEVLDRLVRMSKEDYYNPYQVFDWPDGLPDNQYWMSPELMPINGTEVARSLTEGQLHAISKWESINFYSLNVDGIRELITEIVARIHTKAFEVSSEYFHHIIGEENEHMWFFAEFCLRYGKKIYPGKRVKFEQPPDDRMTHFLVFARLLLFEEIVDFFNKRMGVDERLHPTIRQVNAVHHQDESRHIAFGRQICSLLHQELRAELSNTELAELEEYLKRYLRSQIDSLVNPAVYRDAGLEQPYQVRSAILADPAFRDLEERMLKRSMTFLVREGIMSDATLPSHV